jgi:pimeloyl-ACP methyl ester carboxylesterase
MPRPAAARQDTGMSVNETALRTTSTLTRPGAGLAYEVTGDGMVAGYPGQHWLGQDAHRPPNPEPVDVLEQVTRPALVAVGQHDVPCFREMSAVLARRIPGAQYHLVADAGHMINLEQPAAVNDLLTRFLTDLNPPHPHPAVIETAGITDPHGRPR